MNGVLMGIGVGIGDPDLITIGAVKSIRESDFLCLPNKDKSKCRAYQIASMAVSDISEKQTICFDFEMTKEKDALEKRHQAIYEMVKPLLKSGNTVSFLTIGDPTLYSTFAYLAGLARKDGTEVRIVNGVDSITACAARMGIFLCEGSTQLHVIPDISDLDEALQISGTKVIMKCGNSMEVVRDRLIRLEEEKSTEGAFVGIYAIADCGMPQEKTYIGAENLPKEDHYMMTIIVKEE
ncbi:MAG: precorrin-2 C(20)-methyltransferase [Treponema sp.]|nr:precorrin-2 C(20)-methyltransferase [Treponema sp.]